MDHKYFERILVMCPYYCQNLASANQFKIPGGLYNYGATEKNQASS